MCAAALAVMYAGVPAHGQNPIARVGDVTRLQGQGTNVLVGYGLVTGLAGTGDGGKFMPAMRALAASLERFGTTVDSARDIADAKNVAIVMIEAVVPEHGAREGDLLDVQVTALSAKSLEGGRLLSTPLIYHDRAVDGLFGFAQGRIVVEGMTRTSGRIKGGGRLERDVFINVVASGAELRVTGLSSSWIKPQESYVTLVLDEAHAGWSMAAAIAQALDKELGISAGVDRVALAMDLRNVVVLLPEHQRGDPASWIRDVERTPILMESNEARVTINRVLGTIVVTGDTILSPVIVSQQGMTVTIAPAGEDNGRRGPAEQRDFVAVDVERNRQPNVKDLLEALNRLKVPFKDRVSILEQIHRAGKLHARLIYEG
jgi:flagellar P-ring protein precursor FlgI